MSVDVTVEVPQGQRNKYEIDHETGRMVPDGDPRYEHLRDVDDLPDHRRAEIEHFFAIYKQLEPGKQVTGARWAPRADALAEIEESVRRERSR